MSSKYEFKCSIPETFYDYKGEPNYKTVITHKTDEENLTDLIENFEHFLKGCGFVFSGRLSLVDEEEV